MDSKREFTIYGSSKHGLMDEPRDEPLSLMPLTKIMARCSLRRFSILILVTFLLCLVFLFLRAGSGNSAKKQKPIIRYQLEQQLQEYMKKLEPKNEEEKAEQTLGFKNNGFNQFRSDRIPLDREIPDTRLPECLEKTYSTHLPSTSVIIIFHNEAYSALLRTITSVINRSPPHLLREIILVDDFSSHDDLKDKLDKFVTGNRKVKLFRHDQRKGLIQARMTGAKEATGDVLVFLDSHCEANIMWLEPLLDRVRTNYSNVVCPVIDVISWEKLEYSTVRGPAGVRGGFNWNLQFKWKKVPDYEQKRRNYDETREIKSPTMAGGLFAIDRHYFFDIGAYDPGMDIWGGENLELSFRIWMCGGQLELIPCSRVGHIFRKQQPYTFPGGVDRILVRNNMRLAEGWMDEYKEFYYAKRPDIRKRSYGDISDRLAIRERLHCKSFEWYLKNVYPELPLPNENLVHGGAVRNIESNVCFDTLGHRENGELGLYTCHNMAGNQDFGYTDLGEIVFEEDLCLDVSKRMRGGSIKLLNCHGLGGNQNWEYDDKTLAIRHIVSGLCIEKDSNNKPVMNVCTGLGPQKWTFANHFTPKPGRTKA